MDRIELLKSFLKEDPADEFSAYALALEYVKVNQLVEAIDLLEKLIAKNPDYLPAYYQLGKLYELQGKIKLSVEQYSNGMEVAKKKKDQKTFNELQSALDLLDE